MTNGQIAVDPNCNNSYYGDSFQKGCIPGWFPSHGYARFAYAPYSDYPNSPAIGLTNIDTTPYTSGGYTPVTLNPGTTYILTFLAISYSGSQNSDAGDLNVALTSGLTSGMSYYANTPGAPPFTYAFPERNQPPTPAQLLQLTQVSPPQTGKWSTYKVIFTAPNWSDWQLWFSTPAIRHSSGCNVYITSVAITQGCQKDVFYQNTSSVPQETRVQGTISTGSKVTGGVQGPVLVQAGQRVRFLAVGDIAIKDETSIEQGAEFSAISTNSICPTSAQNVQPPAGCNCLNTSSARMATPATSSSVTTAAAPKAGLFPIPTTGKLEFYPEQVPGVTAGYFLIFNTLGAEVQRIDCRNLAWANGGVTIDASSLSDGLYYYQFVADSYTTKGKFSVKK